MAEGHTTLFRRSSKSLTGKSAIGFSRDRIGAGPKTIVSWREAAAGPLLEDGAPVLKLRPRVSCSGSRETVPSDAVTGPPVRVDRPPRPVPSHDGPHPNCVFYGRPRRASAFGLYEYDVQIVAAPNCPIVQLVVFPDGHDVDDASSFTAVGPAKADKPPGHSTLLSLPAVGRDVPLRHCLGPPADPCCDLGARHGERGWRATAGQGRLGRDRYAERPTTIRSVTGWPDAFVT